jgi:hypothetical protein
VDEFVSVCLQNREPKTQRVHTSVAVVALRHGSTRFPHNSTEVILFFTTKLLQFLGQKLEKDLPYFYFENHYNDLIVFLLHYIWDRDFPRLGHSLITKTSIIHGTKVRNSFRLFVFINSLLILPQSLNRLSQFTEFLPISTSTDCSYFVNTVTSQSAVT